MIIDKEFQNYIDTAKVKCGEAMSLLGVYRFTLEDVYTGEKTVQYYTNIIPTVGRTLIANNLTDPTPDNTMLINYAALGSSTTTPVNADTQLTTETYRNAIASRTNASNVAYATAFFSQVECSGTYREAGIFTNATGAANSGVLLSHVSINVTKTTSQKLTIDWALTIS